MLLRFSTVGNYVIIAWLAHNFVQILYIHLEKMLILSLPSTYSLQNISLCLHICTPHL